MLTLIHNFNHNLADNNPNDLCLNNGRYAVRRGIVIFNPPAHHSLK